MQEMRDIKSLTHKELTLLVDELGLPAFRARQIEEWLYVKHCLSFDDMTNLPKSLRHNLQNAFSLHTPSIIAKQVSNDGTRKYLFGLAGGTAVESVGIPSPDGAHLTVCFSTQAGCPIGCTFCATGRGGFRRNLSSGEIFDQVRMVSEDFNQRVSNVVGMGQGEPFLNYDNVLEALRRMNNPVGLGIGARHITVSTCGIVSNITRFASEPEQFTLAVSLHSAIQRTRDFIMPGVKNSPLEELREALVYYSRKTNRRPTLEYAPISNINDDDEHIQALVDFCHDMLCHVNLIPLNPVDQKQTDSSPLFNPSGHLYLIERALLDAGIECTIRKSRGADIDGACGQLSQRCLDE